MSVLVTGATGFIGRHICACLLGKSYVVTGAARNVTSLTRRFPGVNCVRVDMNRMLSPNDWIPLLAGIDAVVNCAGILQSSATQSAEAIHAAAPKALFDACTALGIRSVIQISAVSADSEAGTEYARTKKAADDYLRSLALDWVVLRPSLVYAQGSYGGTSAVRGFAGLPFVIPLVGDGSQRFQPIYADDLAETVVRCLSDPALARQTLDPVGPETLSLRQIIERTRGWLDLPAARPVRLPLSLVRLAARVGDLVGSGPLRTTALVQLEYGNVSDAVAFERAIGFRPRTMTAAFQAAPSHVQDRWHARLYFLRPILTGTLSLLWLGSGIAGLFNPPESGEAIIARLGVPAPLIPTVEYGLCVLDIALGVAVAFAQSWRVLGSLQFAVVVIYTIGLTWLMPSLWIDGYGPLLKNVPILAAIAVWTALQDDR